MSEATTTLGVIDIQKIMASIPHRYPFLLVDRVVEINGDESGVGIKNVTVNEPQFTGHFPENPVFPGVLMIEANRFRSQERNREDARERLKALILEAAEPPPPPRKRTRPSKGAVERRLKEKAGRSGVKKMRAKPSGD